VPSPAVVVLGATWVVLEGGDFPFWVAYVFVGNCTDMFLCVESFMQLQMKQSLAAQ
jgi:hypothetical protein